MIIDELTAENPASVYSEALAAARAAGFAGFGGACWSAAVAINRVLFSSRGRYTMGVNAALHGAGFALGHVAVTFDAHGGGRVHVDADGRPKLDEEIESWGMLDPDDDCWADQAEELGVQWSEQAACEAALLEVTEQQLLAYAQPGLLQEQMQILQDALARVQPRPSSSTLAMS